jgi:AraC-like DNA-binding protein
VAAVLVNPSGADLRIHGGVMNGRNGPRPYFMPGYRGTLSVKSVVRGAAWYQTASGVFRVDPDHVLILNHGQDYTLTVEGGDEPVETMCPFFSDGLAREAAAVRAHRAGRLLDGGTAEVPGFVERLRRPGAGLAREMGRLARSMAGDREDLADEMHDLVHAVLDEATEERARIDAVAAARPATREEIFRRVHRARDFVHANLAHELTLHDLARAAAMAPHHFHRCFRELVGVPPGRYVTELRLRRAELLLRETRHSVTEICLMVGFESLGTFSSRFKRRYGRPPSQLNRGSQK